MIFYFKNKIVFSLFLMGISEFFFETQAETRSRLERNQLFDQCVQGAFNALDLQNCCQKNQKRLPSRIHPLLVASSCSQETEYQKEYQKILQEGLIPDLLPYLLDQLELRRHQSFCSAGNGFLVSGRPLVSTDQNKIRIHGKERCIRYGNDHLIALLEWLSLKVQQEFKDRFLHVAHLSAPQGGHVYNARGRRSHLSHTNGRDADVGFLNREVVFPVKDPEKTQLENLQAFLINLKLKQIDGF